MKQHEFIWKIHSNIEVNMVQTVNGITECTVKDGIILSHNYKKNNQILLVMNEFNKKYIVPSDKELREIYKIINSSSNGITQQLIEYADKNLIILK